MPRREQAPPADAGESLWLTYYRSIFNPARLKLRMMEKEMPRRFWRNLPEAVLIGPLAAQAAPRIVAMVERGPTAPRGRGTALAAGRHASKRQAVLPATDLADAALPQRQRAWAAQRAAAAGCRECPLGALATQTVWGEGPVGAPLMLVGEQPGDQEDLRGRPFVGPAGQLLDRAIAQLGWDRAALYLTNSVKHFKYEPRGKRRMHKTPAQREADACAHWLEAEIALVQPQAIVALGATAARQLLGRAVAVTRERGQLAARAPTACRCCVTLHPSALLRADGGDRAARYAAWLPTCDARHARTWAPRRGDDLDPTAQRELFGLATGAADRSALRGRAHRRRRRSGAARGRRRVAAARGALQGSTPRGAASTRTVRASTSTPTGCSRARSANCRLRCMRCASGSRAGPASARTTSST